MPKLKNLSGEEVIKIFVSLGFEVVSQRGGHVKLRRITTGTKQILTIPNHKEIDKGTLNAIYRQALRYVSSEDLAPHFYTEQ